MIRHIVLFTARRPDDRERVAAGLARLADIPHAARFEVAQNARTDRYDPSVDFVVYAEFDTEADLDAYRAHPIYEEATRLVRPFRDRRMAADYGPANILVSGRHGRAHRIADGIADETGA